jgi:hypothetical protein
MFSCYLCALPCYPSSLPVLALCQRRAAVKRQIVGGVSRSESRVQPTSPVPSPKSTNVLFSRAAPYLLRQPISHKVEGHHSILLYFAARRRRCWRFAQASKHVPRVGRGRCVAFFVSPASDLATSSTAQPPKNQEKREHCSCVVFGGML